MKPTVPYLRPQRYHNTVLDTERVEEIAAESHEKPTKRAAPKVHAIGSSQTRRAMMYGYTASTEAA
jgi:hypothetical protein